MRRTYLLLFFCSLSLILLLTAFQKSPGYMDAEYYFMGGLNLVNGNGFWENIIWNFLDEPTSLPHPSHSYWMPLYSIIAAVGMLITGVNNFFGARLFFIITSACVAPVTAWFTRSLTQSRRTDILAGVFALFPFLYFPYFATVDGFSFYMLLGTLFLLLLRGIKDSARQGSSNELWALLFLGVTAGLMHLARSDGLAWLILAIFLSLLGNHGLGIKNVVFKSSIVVLGYAIIMTPWMVRNLSLFGTFLQPGASKALWITAYEELFLYPPELLNYHRYFNQGIAALLTLRWDAFWANIQNFIVVQGEILLSPLIIVGFWFERKRIISRIMIFIGFAIWFLMTLIFPAQGMRGGYFHAAAALQPAIWAISAIGFRRIIDWGVKKRGWDDKKAFFLFSSTLVIILAFLTGYAVKNRVFGEDINQPVWERNNNVYKEVENFLVRSGVRKEELVMVNNPAGYNIATNRGAIVIPYAPYDQVVDVARLFNASYLIVEIDQIPGVALYSSPVDTDELIYLGATQSAQVYKFRLNK